PALAPASASGRAAATVAWRSRVGWYPSRVVRERGELRPRPVRFRDRTTTEDEFFVVAASHRLETDRQPVRRAPDGNRDCGHTGNVERRGERNRPHPADAFARNLQRRRTFGPERGDCDGRCEKNVDVVEHAPDRGK